MAMIGGVPPPSQIPTPAAAIAPTISCPSPPMFQTSILKAIAAATPVRMSGVAETSVSANPRPDPKAASVIFA